MLNLAKSSKLGVRLWGVSDETIMKKVYNLDIEGMTVDFPDKLFKMIERESLNMDMYNKLLENQQYLETVKKIEKMHFITDGKWDWEHGLSHYKRVASYVKTILEQLQVDERMVELGMLAALLHDIGLVKGTKTDHAVESSKIFIQYLEDFAIVPQELEIMKQAILDHSKGKEIQSLLGLSLLLADKLDVGYQRVETSSIHDYINTEIAKIRKVDISITETELIVHYKTEEPFDLSVLKNWPKAITIPDKVSKYLNKKFIFLINENEVNVSNFFLRN